MAAGTYCLPSFAKACASAKASAHADSDTRTADKARLSGFAFNR